MEQGTKCLYAIALGLLLIKGNLWASDTCINTAPISRENQQVILDKTACRSYWNRGVSFLGTVITDALWINFNLLSKETLIIAGITVPAWAIARKHDRTIHSYFYDAKRHKNRRQPPYVCKVAFEKGLAIPLLTAAGLAFFSSDEELQTTSYAFWVGLPCSWGYKKALKATQGKHCLRPPNQYFERNYKCYGGFPSGHIMEMTYLTTLFGLRYGPKVWVPLTIISTAMFAELAVCNRHYVSQLVAGAGIGIAFGFATDKLVSKKLGENCSIKMDLDEYQCPALKCCYRF